MRLPMFSVRDVLTGFMTPVLEQNEAAAMRNFRVACEAAASQSLMAARPSDFSLYHVADFDTETGVLYPVTPVVVVCHGGSLYEKV